VNRRNEVVVGTVLILAILLIVFSTFWMQGLRFGSEEREVRARFTEVSQLLVGSNVKFRGVPIGRVERIDLEQGGAAVIVTMTIDADVALPQDPGVMLAPESLFGDWQAEIVSRDRFATYEFAEPLESGMLPGYTLPDMSRLTAVADEIASNLATISNRVELAFTEETALNVREAIENIQRASSELAVLVSSQQVAIEGVSENLERTSEAAGQAAQTMQRAFAEVESAIAGGRLLNIVSNVERTSARTDSLVAVLVDASRELRRTAVSADSTFRQISTIATGIERGEGTLGMLLRDTALYVGLVETNAEVQTLLRDIRRNPRRNLTLTIYSTDSIEGEIEGEGEGEGELEEASG
jgi:phospholipid/cholesterol/gamma-HCH transport system substrate-binding protein